MSFGGYIEWSKEYKSYDEIKKQEDMPLFFQSFGLEIGNLFLYNDREYTLVGLCETNEGYYLIGEDRHGVKKYISCGENVYFIKR